MDGVDLYPFHPSEAHKLDDPERREWLPPGEVIDALSLRSGMTVADIGAGTGYFTIPISARVSHVYAVDFQREMLDLLRPRVGTNVEVIEGEARNTTLPEHSCDVAFLATVWHELDARDEVLDEMRRILKPNGILAILDWRPDVKRPPGPRIEHRISMNDVIADLADRWTGEAHNIGRYTYLITVSSRSAISPIDIGR